MHSDTKHTKRATIARTKKTKTAATFDRAACATKIVLLALTDARRTTPLDSTMIASEAARVAHALADGQLQAAVAIADGIGLDIGVWEDGAVHVLGRTRDLQIIAGRTPVARALAADRVRMEVSQ